MLMSGFSESKELIPAELLMCISFTSGEWPSTVWGAGKHSIHTKSRFCICCNAETLVGAKLRGEKKKTLSNCS